MPPPLDSNDQIMSIINGGSEQRRVRYRQQPDGTMVADTGDDGRPGQVVRGLGEPGSGRQIGQPQQIGQPVGGGNFGQQAGGQQGGRSPYLSLDQVLSQVPWFDGPNSNPMSAGYTGARTAYRDPGLTAAALNFYNNQQQLQHSNEDMNLRRALGYGELDVKRQDVDVRRQMVNERSDPKAAGVSHALDFLKQNPNATPAQMTAAMGKFNQIMQAVRPGYGQADANSPGTPPANNGGPPLAPNAVSVEQEKQAKLGPEVYGYLNQPADDTNRNRLAADAMTNLYRHDQANQGYIQKFGPEVYTLLKQNYGEPAVQSFLGQPAAGLNRAFNPFHQATDSDLAREAWNKYLGNARRAFGDPITGGGPIHPDVQKRYPGLK
jgi:hypothetical protein